MTSKHVWMRMWHDLAAILIRRARKLYVDDGIGLDLDNTIYALDSTTIDLCLTLFPWADFRSTKSAVKMHTLLDLRGPIPSFIHVSNGKMGDALALDLITPEAGAICAWSTARNCSSRPVGAFLDGDDSFSMPASSNQLTLFES